MSVNLFLRVGLAAVFLYPAIAAYFSPDNWIGYFPSLLRNIVPSNILLISFSFYEIALAIWLLVGRWQFFAGLISAATLLGIIVFNLTQLDITFRDIGLFFMAIALLVDSKKTKS